MQSREGERTRREGKERREKWRGGEERREVARIEQVCRGEIRVLQVSLQDWYIDLRESKRDREVWREREFHSCERSDLKIISNTALPC